MDLNGGKRTHTPTTMLRSMPHPELSCCEDACAHARGCSATSSCTRTTTYLPHYPLQGCRDVTITAARLRVCHGAQRKHAGRSCSRSIIKLHGGIWTHTTTMTTVRSMTHPEPCCCKDARAHTHGNARTHAHVCKHAPTPHPHALLPVILHFFLPAPLSLLGLPLSQPSKQHKCPLCKRCHPSLSLTLPPSYTHRLEQRL